MSDSAPPLYERVATDLAGLIAGGQLQPLERVPSVRRLAAQHGISITTAVASLRSLEERGLIEARPKSGYFVARRKPQLAEPGAVAVPRGARLVGAQAMLRRLIEASLDPQVARLGQGIPDAALFPQRALQRCLLSVVRRAPDMFATYALRTEGSPALRTQIVRHYAQLGARIDADELLVTNGCSEALHLAVRAVAQPGDTIAVESPTYFGFLQTVENLGVKIVEIPVHPRDGLSIEQLRSLLDSRAGWDIRACVTIPNFSNPSGASLSLRRKRELVALCRDADIALIEDDICGDLQHQGPRPLPCKTFDRDGRVLLCSSFSKSLAPGARVGFIAAGRYREALRAAKHVSTGATAPLQQEMIAEFMRSGGYERHLRKLRRAFTQQVERASQLVQAAFPADTRISRPQGGFVLWIELAAGIDTLELYERASRVGVDFVPGSLFSASGRYRNCLRLNCGYPLTASAEAAIRRLGTLIKMSA